MDEFRKSASGSISGVTSGESALNGTSPLSVGIVGGGMACRSLFCTATAEAHPWSQTESW